MSTWLRFMCCFDLRSKKPIIHLIICEVHQPTERCDHVVRALRLLALTGWPSSRPPSSTWFRGRGGAKAAGIAIRKAGLEGVVRHGLRASALSWAADGGATEKMLQAFAGHGTAEMFRKYIRGADQRRLAVRAVRAIVCRSPTTKRSGRRKKQHPKIELAERRPPDQLIKCATSWKHAFIDTQFHTYGSSADDAIAGSIGSMTRQATGACRSR
jgi:hypothetical protein